MRVFRAGALYFAAVFAVGCILGPIRELLLVPYLGPVRAVLLEAPVMLVAMIVSARWNLRRLEKPCGPGSRIALGLVALGLLLVAEIAGSLWIRGLPLSAYLASFTTLPGLISLLLFLIFAAIPALLGRRAPDDTAGRRTIPRLPFRVRNQPPE